MSTVNTFSYVLTLNKGREFALESDLCRDFTTRIKRIYKLLGIPHQKCFTINSSKMCLAWTGDCIELYKVLDYVHPRLENSAMNPYEVQQFVQDVEHLRSLPHIGGNVNLVTGSLLKHNQSVFSRLNQGTQIYAWVFPNLDKRYNNLASTEDVSRWGVTLRNAEESSKAASKFYDDAKHFRKFAEGLRKTFENAEESTKASSNNDDGRYFTDDKLKELGEKLRKAFEGKNQTFKAMYGNWSHEMGASNDAKGSSDGSSDKGDSERSWGKSFDSGCPDSNGCNYSHYGFKGEVKTQQNHVLVFMDRKSSPLNIGSKVIIRDHSYQVLLNGDCFSCTKDSDIGLDDVWSVLVVGGRFPHNPGVAGMTRQPNNIMLVHSKFSNYYCFTRNNFVEKVYE